MSESGLDSRMGPQEPPMTPVVIVDDDASVRTYLALFLGRHGYRTISVGTAEEAMGIIGRGEARLLICDVQLRGISGYDLCRRVRETAGPDYIYVILVTARQQEADLIEGLNAGADDVLEKPVAAGHLLARLKAAKRISDLETRLSDQNHRLQQVNRSTEEELRAAEQVQRALLPPRRFELPGLECVSSWRPSAYLSGDIFGCFEIGRGRIAFYLADVAGHGVKASLSAVILHHILQPSFFQLSSQDQEMSPDLIVGRLERAYEAGDLRSYFTLILGMYDVLTGELALCQAGHPSPILVKRDELRFVGDGGYPVALLPGRGFETERLTLSPGDRLVLFSDGIVEAPGHDGGRFGEGRLLDCVAAHRDLPITEVADAIEWAGRQWAGPSEIADDMTYMVLGFDQVDPGAVTLIVDDTGAI